jgi:hypothetical protein
MGGTGLEPVTPSLSRRPDRSRQFARGRKRSANGHLPRCARSCDPHPSERSVRPLRPRRRGSAVENGIVHSRRSERSGKRQPSTGCLATCKSNIGSGHPTVRSRARSPRETSRGSRSRDRSGSGRVPEAEYGPGVCRIRVHPLLGGEPNAWDAFRDQGVLDAIFRFLRADGVDAQDDRPSCPLKAIGRTRWRPTIAYTSSSYDRPLSAAPLAPRRPPAPRRLAVRARLPVALRRLGRRLRRAQSRRLSRSPHRCL